MNKKNAFINRLQAFILTAALCLEGTPPGWAQMQPALASVPETLSRLASELQIQDFPKKLGHVTEVFQGKEKKSPLVILVQDAHSVPDAQRSIAGLTQYFEQKAGLAWVGLEGASQRLDPLMLANYPDREILKEALEFYLAQGEISGAVASAVLGSGKITFEGLEENELYEEDITAYLAALEERGPIEKEVQQLRLSLESLRDAWYPAEVVQLERKKEAFEKGQGDLFDYLRALEKFRSKMPADFSGTHPLLSSLLSLTRENDKNTGRRLDLEIKVLASVLEKRISSHASQADFFREKQAYETEQKAPEEFLAYLLELNERYNTKAHVSVLLARKAEDYQRIHQAAGEDLSREIASAVKLAKQTVLRSELDQRVEDAAEKLTLIEKALSLELHAAEWTRLLALKNADGGMAGGNVQEETLENLENQISETLAKITQTAQPWMRFYEQAEARETAMWEKLQTKMKSTKMSVAMLVTGGFHREGLAQRFRKSGISYWIVTPSVSALPEGETYQRQMQGEVSWKKQFQIEDGRVDVYGAFHRDMFLRLKRIEEERNGAASQALVMRRWRENILRDLAGQRKLQDASKYTRLLDRWMLMSLDKFKQQSLTRFWEKRVEQFTAGLEKLNAQKRLNPETLSGLLAKPAAVGWNAVKVLSHETVPAAWLEPQPSILKEEKTSLPTVSQPEKAAALKTQEKIPLQTDSGLWIIRNLGQRVFQNPAANFLLSGPAGTFEPVNFSLPFFAGRSELRTQEEQEEEISLEEALSKPQLEKLKIAVNLKDVGAYYRDGVLSYEDSLRKLKKLLPILRSQGAGSVYLYGGLYDMGGISYRVHRDRPDKRTEYYAGNNEKTLVKIEGYQTKKTEYEVPQGATPETRSMTVQDGHNPFSIYSMLKLNPHLSSEEENWGTEARTREQLQDVIETAHRLGMKVTLDFIPWLAPDAIDESNYQWTFYQELPDSENQRFRELPEKNEAGESKESFLKRKIDENPSYFTVRIKEDGRPERVILVRHLVSDMGGTNVDQAVLNPFLPAVRSYYKQALSGLVDLGADEVRVDLGHVYLREYITDLGRGYFSDAYWRSIPAELKAELEEALRTIEEPWPEILEAGKQYAKNKNKEMHYVMEAYDEAHLAKLRQLGADKTYYADVFKNLVRVARGEPAHYLEAALRHAVGNRGGLMAFPSNFDQFPLRSIKGAQNAARALLLVMPELGLDVMWDLRDWLGFSGQVFPMVGGDQNAEKESDHTFANQREFEITTQAEAFRRAVRSSPAAQALADTLRAIGTREEHYIEFLDNARRDRFTTFAWKTENPGDWRLLVLNFKPQESEGVDFVDLPREALIEAGARGFKAVDAETGEAFEIDPEFRLNKISVSADKQYRIIKLTRELSDEPLVVSRDMRSELREVSQDTPEEAAGKELREKLFHRRILDEETKALLISLLPKPLMNHLKINPENILWLNDGRRPVSPMEYVFRVSFQDPSIAVFSLAPAMPGPLGLSKEAAVYLPLQDLGDGYLGLLQHGRVQGFEPGVILEGEDKKYAENPFAYWLENNLDPASVKMDLKGTLLMPLAIGPKQLELLGFKQTKNESLWYRKTRDIQTGRSELRDADARVESTLFGRGRAVTEDYRINGEEMPEDVYEGLVEKISQRIDVLAARDIGEAQRAVDILEHIKKIKAGKGLSLFPEQRWSRTSYMTGGASRTNLLLGEGFLALPDLAEEALFRLAETSFDLASVKSPASGKTADVLYRPREAFEAAHQDFVELEDEAVLRSAVKSFGKLAADTHWSDTRRLFEDWLNADIGAFKKGDRKPVFPILEQAGFLSQVLALKGWNKLPVDPPNPDEILARDPDKAAAFFEILYPLAVFSFYRYQFFSHANSLRNVFLNSIRKSVEEIDQQLRERIRSTPELMRSSIMIKPPRVVDYLAAMTFNFSNDADVPTRLIIGAQIPLLEGYQRNVGKPDRISERNTSVIDTAVWGIFEKTMDDGENEIHPAWHLYADVTLGVPPSAAAFKAQRERAIRLAYEMFRAPKEWQASWFEDKFRFNKFPADQPVKLAIPGLESFTNEDLKELSQMASGYRWKGLSALRGNVSGTDSASQLGKVNEALSHKHGRFEILTVNESPIAPFWQANSRLHYQVTPGAEGAPDQLKIFRDETLFWSELLVWTSARTSSTHYRDDELPLILPVIGAIRRTFLQPETPASPFNFEGVNVKEWVRDILAVHDLVQTRFWELVEAQYEEFAKFFYQESTPETEQRLFWYYSLMRHPKGIFAEIAQNLQQIPGTHRLTPASAAFLLDALYAIYWSGPERNALIDGNRWILGSLLHYMRFHPDGISIPDIDGFKTFLTQDLAPAGTDLNEADFTAWLHEAIEKHGRFREVGALVETAELAEPPVDSAAAQMRTRPAEDSEFVFDPEDFPAERLLKTGLQPWQNLKNREALWRGTYRGGLSVPGSAFRYRFKEGRVAEGSVLSVRVYPKTESAEGLFEIWDEASGSQEPLVRIPLNEAQRERYARGAEFGQEWEKIPDLQKVVMGQNGFEEIETRENGFLPLRHNEQQAALYLPQLSAAGSAKLVIQRQEKEVLFFTASGEYLGQVTFGAAGRQALSNSDKIKVLAPIPVPLEAPESASLSEYTNLVALASGLQPLMERGRGYDKLVVTERREGEAGLEDRSFVLPRSMLEDVPSAIEKIKSLLESSDPAYQLRMIKTDLGEAQKNGAYFEPEYRFPVLPPLQNQDGRWTDSTYQRYREAHASAAEELRVMRALRNLDRFRVQNQDALGPHWSKAGPFRRAAEQLLQSEEGGFRFNAKGIEFKTLNSLSDMEYQQLDAARRRKHTYTPFYGIGIASADHFRLLAGELTLSKNPNPDPTMYFFIRTPRGEQANVQIFDVNTGEKIDEQERAFRELGARYEEARVRLIEALAAAAQKGSVLHLNRISHELDAFMEKLGTGDELKDLELRFELTGKLSQFLPSLIKSDFVEINTAVIMLVLREILAEGAENALSRAELFQREFSRRSDELTFYLYATLDQYQESFGMNPENAEPGYAEKFYDFLENAFLPAAELYSAETGHSQLIHPDSYYEGVASKLSAEQDRLREEIETYLEEAPPETRRRDVLSLMHGFETQRSAKGSVSPMSAYFIRKIFRAIAWQEKQITDEEAAERATYITAYGGVEGIGASSALIEYRGKGQTETDAIIIDAGIKIDNQNTPPAWPDEFPHVPKAVFLTHAHLDHVGAAIDLWEKLGRKVPFYVTPGTADILAKVLEFANSSPRDAEGPVHARDPGVVEEFIKALKILKPNRWYAVSPKMKVYFHGPVGHLHGAASLVISTPDGNTFLSGDVSARAQGPVPAFASLPPEIAANMDQAFTESTYGMLRRALEEIQEGKLVNAVAERINAGGRVLIPAFANGRAQRVLLLLLQNLEKIKGDNADFKIYIDGQAAVFTALYLKAYPEVFRPYQELIQRHVVLIQSDDYQVRGRMRSEIEERDGGQRTVIISSAGNASQGRSRYWATRLANDPKSGIFFTGYMDPQEVGSQLLRAATEGQERFYFGPDLGYLPLLAKIGEFKLAGHASGDEIIEKVLEPMGESLRQVWIGHGGFAQSREIYEWIREHRPEWNPVILKKLDRMQGSVPLTLPGLEARREFFESLDAEVLYPEAPETEIKRTAKNTESVPEAPGDQEAHLESDLILDEVPAAPIPDAQPLDESKIVEEGAAVLPAEDTTAVSDEAETLSEPGAFDEIALTLEKERLTKESRQALLELRLKQVPDLKAADAVVWLKAEVLRRLLPEKAGTFGESTLRGDLKEIRARSELRSVVDPVLRSLARPENAPRQSVLAGFISWVDARGFAAAKQEIENEARGNEHFLTLMDGRSEDEGELVRRIEAETKFQKTHPSQDKDRETFVAGLLSDAEQDAADFFRSAPEGTLHYSFAFPLQGSRKVQDWFLEYARTLQKIRAAHPGRVTADLRLLVTREENQDPSRKDFFRALARTGLAKVLETSTAASAAMQLKWFVEDGKNKNALVYGSEDLPVEEIDASRLVRSEVDAEAAFPVALLLTRQLAKVPGHLPAELLGRLTQELPAGMLTFNGTSLEITTLAMELMYRFRADRRIQTAA